MKQTALETIKAHVKAVAAFEKDGIYAIVDISNAICSSIENGGCVYLCGNGGSAADCQHIAGEFIGRFRRERKALPAVALTADSSVMTSLGNDYNFDEVFVKQVEGLVKPCDILWAFSTSGTSTNILKAAKLAKTIGARVISFTGKADSELEKLSDFCLCADTPYTSTSQEVHILAYHIICQLVENHFADKSQAADKP